MNEHLAGFFGMELFLNKHFGKKVSDRDFMRYYWSILL